MSFIWKAHRNERISNVPGGVIEGRGDRTQWYEGIKRNNGTGEVKWGEGWDDKREEVDSKE